MNIHLYNLFHIGDLFFNQSIVKNICKSNPKHKFTMYCLYNFGIFSDIPNLEVKHATSHPQFELLQKNHPFMRIGEDTLIINLWIAALFMNASSGYQQDQIECQLYNYQCALYNVFRSINYFLKTDLLLTHLSKNELLPVLPSVPMESFSEWYNTMNNKQLVFYYNYLPKSGQPIPFTNHDEILMKLATMFSDTLFLVPLIGPELKYMIVTNCLTNIVCCKETFGYAQTESGTHLIQLAKVAEQCNYSIHFDIGACMYYLNSNIYNSKHTVLHIGVNTGYYDKIVSNFTKEDEDFVSKKIIYLYANDNNIDYIVNKLKAKA
jgi:hypothetical protein